VGSPRSPEVEAGELLPERDAVDARDQRVQHVGLGVEDPTDLGREVRHAERHVLLPDDGSAERLEPPLEVREGSARPDVVRADEVEGRAVVLHEPGDERVDLLVRQRPGR
jgi:hypothetical protein